ncbi:MAG: tRNA 2-thiouridine(34) synthase MnmA [Actinomycetota bacterium]|nr:tRNA 2-thiouridine(34) synthase MnmA [Actinomycetota bacterium]
MVRRDTDTVVVGMSGGVDSSVAAALLKEQGYRVMGICLDLHHGDGDEKKYGNGGISDARRVAKKIGIPLYVLNMKGFFEDRVINQTKMSYLSGETPNPCVICNRLVKFERLLSIAERIGAKLATGHYARIIRNTTGTVELHRAPHAKDQSYFLWVIPYENLHRIVFPLGAITKEETRELARRMCLPVSSKPESQDLCFDLRRESESHVGGGGFVSSRIPEKTGGLIIDDEGRIVGKHMGIEHFTIGQRKGLGLGLPEAYRVVDICREKNSVIVSKRGLPKVKRAFLRDMNYISENPPEVPVDGEVVTRYRKPPVRARLFSLARGKAVLEFEALEEPVAPGQSAVFYSGERLLAGGVATRMQVDERGDQIFRVANGSKAESFFGSGYGSFSAGVALNYPKR